MTTDLVPSSASRRPPHRYAPRRIPAPQVGRLRSALVAEHARAPFTPADPRDAAYRVVTVARRLGLETEVIRGGLDVGGAELDHVWSIVDGAVVDVTLPLWSEHFTVTLRAYIAGDVETDVLDRDVHGYALEWRVVGDYPERYRYVGSPVWSGRPGEAAR